MEQRVACPSCGAPNPGTSTYCGACGTALQPPTVPPIACWNCRATNPAGRAYCGSCGQPLTATPAVASREDRGRNPVLLALAIALTLFLLLASIFLVIVIMDGRSGGIAGGGEPTPALTQPPRATEPPLETEPPRASATPYPTTTPTPTPEPRRTPKPTPTLGPAQGFVCAGDSAMPVTGPAGTTWNLVQVDFRTYRDYDRVIYQLRRARDGEPGIEPLASVRHSIPGEGEYIGAPPWTEGSDWRLDVLLVNGVRDRARIDPPYEPRGMRIVKSLSTRAYQSHVNYYDPADDPYLAQPGVYSTIDVTGEGCHALRVVGWDDHGDDTASVYVDIQH